MLYNHDLYVSAARLSCRLNRRLSRIFFRPAAGGLAKFTAAKPNIFFGWRLIRRLTGLRALHLEITGDKKIDRAETPVYFLMPCLSGGIMFLGCLSICAGVHCALEAFPTGLLSASSFKTAIWESVY